MKKTRNTKGKKVNWISCNSCKLWVHPKCTGLTNKDFKKISNIEVKKCNPSLFFKCIKCCIKTATIAGFDLSSFKKATSQTKEISTQTIEIEI